MKIIPIEVGNKVRSKEANKLIPQVPLTVQSCTAPKPKTEPNIDKILLVPVFILLSTLFPVSYTHLRAHET